MGILDRKSAKGIPLAGSKHSRAVLGLLKELSETSTSVKEVSGRSVKVGTELSEGSDFSVLSKVELKRTGDGLHKLGLGGGTDSRDGHCQMLVWLAKKNPRSLTADVDSGSDTLEEKLRFQEDLTVGNGNNVGGNVGRHVTTLSLNDGEGSEGTSSVVGVHLGGTLEKTRVEVENLKERVK